MIISSPVVRRSFERQDACLQDQVAVQAPLPGCDDESSSSSALVEGEALDGHDAEITGQPRHQIGEDLANGRHGLGIVDNGHSKGRRIREGIERQMREDRIRGGHRVDPVQPNDLRSQRMCGKICIRDDDLIPVSELSKGAKKIGSEEGVDAAQHDRFPFKG